MKESLCYTRQVKCRLGALNAGQAYEVRLIVELGLILRLKSTFHPKPERKET
jgi:hypothetical protein